MSKGWLWFIITVMLLLLVSGVVINMAWPIWLILVFGLLEIIAWLCAAVYLIAPRWPG